MIQVIIITLPQRWNNWEREMKPLGPDIQQGRFGRELQCSALDMFIFVSVIVMLRFPWMLPLSSWCKRSGRESAGENLVLTGRTQALCLLYSQQFYTVFPTSTTEYFKQHRWQAKQSSFTAAAPITMSSTAGWTLDQKLLFPPQVQSILINWNPVATKHGVVDKTMTCQIISWIEITLNLLSLPNNIIYKFSNMLKPNLLELYFLI